MVFWVAPLAVLIGSPRGVFEWMLKVLASPAGALLLLGIVTASVAHEMLKLTRVERVRSVGAPTSAKLSRPESAKNIIVTVTHSSIVMLPNYALLAYLWSFPDTLLGTAFWASITWFFLLVFVLNLIRPNRLGFLFAPRRWRFGHPRS